MRFDFFGPIKQRYTELVDIAIGEDPQYWNDGPLTRADVAEICGWQLYVMGRQAA